MNSPTAFRNLHTTSLRATALAGFIASVLFGCSFAFAQQLPDKKVVKEWVAKVRPSGGVAPYSSGPYHFVAKFHYSFGNETHDGVYEVLWDAPDRVRVEFRVGDTGETDVIWGDKRSVLRNTPTMTYAKWSAAAMLGQPADFRVPFAHAASSIHRIISKGAGASRQICADVGDDLVQTDQLCFGATTSDLVEEHLHPSGNARVVGGFMEIDATDFMQLDGRRYPSHLVRKWGPETIDATVEKWETVEKFGEDTFTPPAKSVVWDRCAAPTIETKKLDAQTSGLIFVPDRGGNGMRIDFFAFYRVIGADGRVEQSVPLFGSPKKGAPGEAVGDRAAIQLCNGKPIRYETVTTFWPSLLALPGN
jgi:hypothetical protein